MKYLRQLFAIVLIGLLSNTVLAVDWLRNNEQIAQAHFNAGHYTEAAALFNDAYRQGVALYRAGQYAAAASAFNRVERPAVQLDAQYNLGNAHFMQGDYGGAIQAYEQVLRTDPDHADARYNLALVRQLLTQTVEQKAPAQSEQQSQSNSQIQQSNKQSSETKEHNKTEQQESSKDQKSEPQKITADASQSTTKNSDENQSGQQSNEQQSSGNQSSSAAGNNKNGDDNTTVTGQVGDEQQSSAGQQVNEKQKAVGGEQQLTNDNQLSSNDESQQIESSVGQQQLSSSAELTDQLTGTKQQSFSGQKKANVQQHSDNNAGQQVQIRGDLSGQQPDEQPSSSGYQLSSAAGEQPADKKALSVDEQLNQQSSDAGQQPKNSPPYSEHNSANNNAQPPFSGQQRANNDTGQRQLNQGNSDTAPDLTNAGQQSDAVEQFDQLGQQLPTETNPNDTGVNSLDANHPPMLGASMAIIEQRLENIEGEPVLLLRNQFQLEELRALQQSGGRAWEPRPW